LFGDATPPCSPRGVGRVRLSPSSPVDDGPPPSESVHRKDSKPLDLSAGGGLYQAEEDFWGQKEFRGLWANSLFDLSPPTTLERPEETTYPPVWEEMGATDGHEEFTGRWADSVYLVSPKEACEARGHHVLPSVPA
jgi:hypothetical protein